MDTDGDGTVGVAELQARQALDTNKDGTVSEEEVRFFLSGAESFDRETFRLSGYLLLRPYLTQDPEKEEEAGQPPQEGEAEEVVEAITPPPVVSDPTPYEEADVEATSSTPEVYDPWRANQPKEPEVRPVFRIRIQLNPGPDPAKNLNPDPENPESGS